MSKTKLHVRKGDRVKVIAGKDHGLVGEVIAVYPEKDRVTVAGSTSSSGTSRTPRSSPRAGR